MIIISNYFFKLIGYDYCRMQRPVVDLSVLSGFIRGSRMIASFHLRPVLSFATILPVISSFLSRQLIMNRPVPVFTIFSASWI